MSTCSCRRHETKCVAIFGSCYGVTCNSEIKRTLMIPSCFNWVIVWHYLLTETIAFSKF